MNTLLRLQDWYLEQCDGDWEHDQGVKIDTLDNPGWSLKISLAGTSLEGACFTPSERGVGQEAMPESEDWWFTKLDNGCFVGYGGPKHLDTLLTIFLDWAASQKE